MHYINFTSFPLCSFLKSLLLSFRELIVIFCFSFIPGRITIIAESKGPQTYLLKLEIKDVANGDAGNYKVIAKNELGESNATIKLNFDSKCC